MTAGGPWWLEPGAAGCSCCENALHVEALVHCHRCDQPVCPLCVTTVFETHDVVCTRCHAGEGED